MDNLSSYVEHLRRQDEETSAAAHAVSFGLPYINLIGYPILPDVLLIIPQETAVQCKAISFIRTGQKVRVAMVDPSNESNRKALTELGQKQGYTFSYSVCTESSFQYALDIFKEISDKKNTETAQADATQKAEFNFDQIQSLHDLRTQFSSVSTTALVDLLFAGAVKTNASDIHIEPTENEMRVRYRIDGVLQEVSVLPKTMYKPLTSRIKNMSSLKLDVRDVPQDGRFTINTLGQSIDIRISTLPASGGEILDMRLLNSKEQVEDITRLGIRPDALALIQDAISKPNGLILNTGPTGSGKTTTLYAILTSLNKPGVKIITLEDPIEYRIPGIDQVQIDPEHKYTFASALRASLRQDPNIIMVGEIRDKETADISLQASMTGHLVLSTLHTNNAPATIPRLIDMGVEPYLLAGAINLIIAQRLVRTICSVCKGKGCVECNDTGFKGRIALIECLKPSKAIEQLIMTKAPMSQFLEIAKSEGMKTMEEDGMEKVAQGITTKEEVWRVTKE